MDEKTVFLADIIQSRKSDERYKLQKKLIAIIKYLNMCYSTQLIKQVEISSGDSFQGLFHSPESAFLYWRIVQILLYPTKIRVGIGIGTLDYMDVSFGSNLLDGKAYHQAKAAIDDMSERTGECIKLKKEHDSFEVVVNTMFEMYMKIRQNFGSNSMRIMLVNEMLNPLSMDGTIHYIDHESQEVMSLLDEIMNESLIGNQYSSVMPRKVEQITIDNIREMEPFSLKQVVDNKRLYSSNYVLRGIQDNVASIIGTTRQNVQRYYAKWIADERMYASEIALLLCEVGK